MDHHTRFTALLLRHQSELRAFVASVIRDWQAVDDILQDTAVVLWRKFAEYDERYSFGAWARGIAALEIRKHAARSARMPTLLEPEAVATLQAVWDEDPVAGRSGDRLDALGRCLEHVDGSARDLLELRYREQLPLDAIARRCDRTVDSVGKFLQRLRHALGQCVQRQLASGGRS